MSSFRRFSLTVQTDLMKKIGLCGVVLLSAVICVAAATQPSPHLSRGWL